MGNKTTQIYLYTCRSWCFYVPQLLGLQKKKNNSNKLSFESKSFVVVVDMTASASYAEIISEFASLGLRDLDVGKKLTR